eukprot:3344678-Rhodomonas_salina.2
MYRYVSTGNDIASVRGCPSQYQRSYRATQPASTTHPYQLLTRFSTALVCSATGAAVRASVRTRAPCPLATAAPVGSRFVPRFLYRAHESVPIPDPYSGCAQGKIAPKPPELSQKPADQGEGASQTCLRMGGVPFLTCEGVTLSVAKLLHIGIEWQLHYFSSLYNGFGVTVALVLSHLRLFLLLPGQHARSSTKHQYAQYNTHQYVPYNSHQYARYHSSVRTVQHNSTEHQDARCRTTGSRPLSTNAASSTKNTVQIKGASTNLLHKRSKELEVLGLDEGEAAVGAYRTFSTGEYQLHVAHSCTQYCNEYQLRVAHSFQYWRVSATRST